jgi:hypothetical protein
MNIKRNGALASALCLFLSTFSRQQTVPVRDHAHSRGKQRKENT